MRYILMANNFMLFEAYPKYTENSVLFVAPNPETSNIFSLVSLDNYGFTNYAFN